jgi:hypothetical protein
MTDGRFVEANGYYGRGREYEYSNRSLDNMYMAVRRCLIANT